MITSSSKILFLSIVGIFFGGASSSFLSEDEDHGRFLEEMAAMDDQEVARFLTEDEGRFLRESSDEKLLMERCGNRNSCLDGFECTGMGIGNRCFPANCIEEELKAIGFDGNAYKNMVLEKAGVTEDELIEAAAVAASVVGQDNDEDDNDDGGFRLLYNSVMDVLQENREPLDEVREIQRKCRSPLSTRNSTQDNDGRFEYFGLQIEMGALAAFSYTCLSAGDGTRDNPLIEFNRLCLGAGPKLLGQAAIVVGQVCNSDDIDTLGCGSLWADLDVVLAYGVGAAGGIALNARAMYEFSIGLGGGLGASVSTCATWKRPGPFTGSPTFGPFIFFPTASPTINPTTEPTA